MKNNKKTPSQTERISCVLLAGTEPRSIKEIALIPAYHGPRILPIRHEYIAAAVEDYVDCDPSCRLVDAFHACPENAARYIGLFDVKTTGCDDFRWVIGATNSMDGTLSFSLHSGIVIPGAEMAIAFHASERLIGRKGYVPREEIPNLVNENLFILRDHYNLCIERMDHLKSCKLTSPAAAELILSLFGTEVIAGRMAYEFIMAWKKPQFDYLKPRTMWSLYCLCAWFLKRLRDVVMIDRTMNLNHFFDDMSKFDKKPTRWVQSTFA